MNTSANERKVILRKVAENSYESLRGARFRIFRADLTEYTDGQPTESDGTSKGYCDSLDSGI